MSVTPPKTRNDPCPCGSGKRYKQCHGAVPTVTITAVTQQPEWARLADEGLAAQRAGDLIQAGQKYQASLLIKPDNPDVTHMLGVAHMQQGDTEAAMATIERAGDQVGWRYPSFLTNYALAIADYLGCAPPHDIEQRRQQVESIRVQRAQSRPSDPKPLVSIVLPSYNHLRFVEEALRSVFSQTYRNIELIVIDDGSSDESVVLIKRVLDECPFPVQFLTRANAGAHFTINQGLALARGRYVNVLNSDDAFTPQRIERCVHRIHESGALWGFALCEIVDVVGKRVDHADPRATSLWNAMGEIVVADWVGLRLLKENSVISSGNLFVDRELLQKIGGMANLRYNHDWKCCLDLLRHDEPVIIAETLYKYRLHGANTISESASKARTEADAIIYDYIERVTDPMSVTNPLALAGGRDDETITSLRLRAALHHGWTAADLKGIAARARAAPQLPSKHGPAQVHFVGFLQAANGLGESLRLLMRSSEASGLVSTATDIPLSDIGRVSVPEIRLTPRPVAPICVVAVNPDSLSQARHRLGRHLVRDYMVGYWYWELAELPRTWIPELAHFDELWVATDFVRDAVLRSAIGTRIEAHVLPPPVVAPESKKRYPRSDFGLPDDAFVFHFSFDYGSYPTRKNPIAVVNAFMQAFPRGDERASLLIKSTRSGTFPAYAKALAELAGRDSRILLLDRHLSRDELVGLQMSCDCYVSLHRSEGLGLGMAECMALGKPVIATRYSGNVDFMNDQNSLLVDFSLKPLTQDDYVVWLDWQGRVWADPDVAQAAGHMKRLFEDRAFAKVMGENARQSIATQYSVERTGALLRERVRAIEARLVSRKILIRSA